MAFLTRGHRRGYVAVDVHGEVFFVTRQLGLKKKEVATRLGRPEELPSVAEVKKIISKKLIRELSHVTNHDQEKGKSRNERDTAKTHENDIEHDDPDLDLEPEI